MVIGRRTATIRKPGSRSEPPEWIDRLAPKALALVGAGTCEIYGGIHAMQGNPTGCMGLQDYLGHDWKSKAGLPIVNVPGCPVQPDEESSQWIPATQAIHREAAPSSPTERLTATGE
jgi:hydrogenase small subunit